MNLVLPDAAIIANDVRHALAEDIGSGDITAQLISQAQQAKATAITREHAVLAGSAWANEVFRQVDPTLQVNWQAEDGASIIPDQILFTVTGSARAILTAERAALNFIQLLSGTARTAANYADKVKHTKVTLLDTRKTIPGLRIAQKYAVTCGGCRNHRIGLYDQFLIKENHIAACGSITAAVQQAKQIAPDKKVEIEVESHAELQQAIQAGADIVMLDNFSIADSVTAVKHVAGRVKLEASGNITDETLVSVAETGVDYISIGALTKHCQAVDLSMRLVGA